MAGGAFHLKGMMGPALCEKCTFTNNRFFGTVFTTSKGDVSYFSKEALAPAAVFAGWKPENKTCTANSNFKDCMAGHILYLKFGRDHPETLSFKDCFFDSSMVMLRFC